jgi:hypothetical protein
MRETKGLAIGFVELEHRKLSFFVFVFHVLRKTSPDPGARKGHDQVTIL